MKKEIPCRAGDFLLEKCLKHILQETERDGHTAGQNVSRETMEENADKIGKNRWF